MSVHIGQADQLLDRGLHRTRGRLHRWFDQPRQPGHRQPHIAHQQPVQIAAALLAAGGGVGLAADIVLMAQEATLRLAYTAVGLSPDCGSTWLLARRLGEARAISSPVLP
ncbi:enoyl-CoA hydratase-related protein [Nocardia sp. 2YAB30]|uniref:enoyl-CoA hydratase-related protein n=1 Tax=unclassified Nocardia TaxID=2637762 RepID=UPI003F98C412